MRIWSELTITSRLGEGDAEATEENLVEAGNNIPPKRGRRQNVLAGAESYVSLKK